MHLGIGLHGPAEVDLQPARQLQAEITLQHIGNTTLSGLAVDTNHFLV